MPAPYSRLLIPKAILVFFQLICGSDAATPPDNVEMASIYTADQKDRGSSLEKVNWTVVTPRDAIRRKRVREMIAQGALRTGKDYERAAYVFQHGETPEDILLAHVLAITALGKGNQKARWLSAATLDRYLHRQKQPQVFGTQFVNRDESKQEGWTMEPYNRELIAPSLLEANCVPDREHQTRMLDAVRRGDEPAAPKRKPCSGTVQ